MTASLLLSVFPTFAVGGAQIRFTTLANQFGRSWRHAIVAMDGVTTARDRLDPALDVTFPPVEIRKGDLIGNVLRFRALLRELRPRALLTHNFGSIEWSMANRFRLAHQVHVEDGFGPEERSRQLPRRVWLRRVFLRGRTVALPSQTLMRIALETWKLRRRDVHYVPNGIDLAGFAQSTAAPGWAGSGPVVGTVAALRPEKNIARLIRAFQLAMPDGPARLVLVGDGGERGALERLAGELGIADRVIFAGHVAQPASAMQAFDVFALSSDTEQMPISLLEAMASARAVAATDVGDIRAMLPEPQGAFVTRPDDASLAEALRRLLGDGELRRSLGALNRAKAEQAFGQDQMVAHWADLLEGGARR
ncbi:MAG: glycosyltransferase [Pseudomonadota bacterium]|nr:glycosyltransferase [Pseudomonadota bacterium]